MIYLNRNIGYYVTWTCKTMETSQQWTVCQGERKHYRRPWKADRPHSSHWLRGSSLWKHISQREGGHSLLQTVVFLQIHPIENNECDCSVTVGMASLAPAAFLDCRRSCAPRRTWGDKQASYSPEVLLCLCIKCGVFLDSR